MVLLSAVAYWGLMPCVMGRRRFGRRVCESLCLLQIGWPMAVATKERMSFVSNVHKAKDKILRKMVQQGELPLRPGEVPPAPRMSALLSLLL